MTFKENKYPDAKCSASVSGFIVQIWLPHHPDFEDNLYPNEIEGLSVEKWLLEKPEVASVFVRSDGYEYGYQVVVISSMTAH